MLINVRVISHLLEQLSEVCSVVKQPWWFIALINVLALEEQALYRDMQMAPLYGTMSLKTQVWNNR